METITKVLLFTVVDVKHPITADILKKVCELENVEVQRLAIFFKKSLQAFVEFKSVDDAVFIQSELNGCDIYPGCCTLTVEFSPARDINVRINSDVSYNIDISRDKTRKQDPKLTTNHPPSSTNVQPAARSSQLHNNGAGINFNLNTSSVYPPLPMQRLPPMFTPTPTPLVPIIPVANQVIQNKLNINGGEGHVTMVFGIHNEKVNCDHLFNLFCIYGNVVKIKMLMKKNNPSCAMIQYTDRLSTELAVTHLNNLTVFGQLLKVAMSKNYFIKDSFATTLVDGSPSTVSYIKSPNNRFPFIPGGDGSKFSGLPGPSKSLHYSNAPPDCVEHNLVLLLKSFKAHPPVKHLTLSKPNGHQTMTGVLEFPSVSMAVEALMTVGHVTLYKNTPYTPASLCYPTVKQPYVFKLTFLPWK